MRVDNKNLETSLSISGNDLTLKVKYIEQPKIKFNARFNLMSFLNVEEIIMKAGQRVTISIAPVDSFGNKARVDGFPVWNLSDESLGAIDVAPDAMSVLFSSSGKVGQVTVDVAADADLSDGIRNIGGSVAIDIEAGEATDLGVHIDPIVIDAQPVDTTTEAPADTTTEAPVEVAPVAVDTTVDTTSEAPVDASVDTSAPVDTTTEASVDTTVDTSAPADATTEAPVDTTIDTSAPVDTTTEASVDTTVDTSAPADTTVDPNQPV